MAILRFKINPARIAALTTQHAIEIECANGDAQVEGKAPGAPAPDQSVGGLHAFALILVDAA